MKLNLLCPDDPLLLHPAHFWERLFVAYYRRQCPECACTCSCTWRNSTDLGPRSSQISIRYFVGCLCVCLPPLWDVALERGDFKHVTLLI